MDRTPTTPELPGQEVILLNDTARGCVVTYVPGFLPEAEANALFAVLSTGTPFHAEAPVMFGRAVEVRRRTYSYAMSDTHGCRRLVRS